MIQVTDARGNTTTYGYDRNDRRIQETRPLGQTQTTAYDATGKLTEATDAKGNRITFAYDDAGRRIRETHTPKGSKAPSRTITYSYDNAGRLAGYTDANAGHPDHQKATASNTRSTPWGARSKRLSP
jgi:YD repeat-containing protein